MFETPCKNCGKPHNTSSLWCSVGCQIEAMQTATGDEIEILSKPNIRRVKIARRKSK